MKNYLAIGYLAIGLIAFGIPLILFAQTTKQKADIDTLSRQLDVLIQEIRLARNDLKPTQPILGGAGFNNRYSVVATSSSATVGTSTKPTILFSASDTCSSRIISTTYQPIMLAFGRLSVATTSLDQSIGHIQTASSTVAYDSDIYGCGRVYAVGIDIFREKASSTVTITEFK